MRSWPWGSFTILFLVFIASQRLEISTTLATGLLNAVLKRVVLLIVVAGVLLLFVVAVLRKGAPRPVTAQPPAVPPPVAVTNAPAVSNPSPVSVVPPPLRQA